MSDGEALLRSIILNPAEDTPRLAYADWLQEKGNEERAEFIRVQVAIAAECPVEVSFDVDKPPYRPDEFRLLMGREGDNWREWAGVLTDVWTHSQNGTDDWWNHFYFARGFVCDLRLCFADWVQNADAIRAEHPVRRVRLTTRPSKVFHGPKWDSPACETLQGRGWPEFPLHTTTTDMLAAIWPGIEFESPPFPPLSQAFQGIEAVG